MLVLEDLHWADPASLALLAALAREVSASRILVLGTSRTGLDLPEATVLPLGPWDVPAVAAYLGRLGAAHGTWAAVVHELGGGNPLYTRELGRLLVREGRLERPAGDIDLPDGLRRLVARRTAHLTPAGRAALGAAAAFGAEVDTTVLAIGELTPAVEAGLLVDDPWAPARLRFAHELVRQACYADLSRDARIRAHARIADALTTTGAGPIEIARHRVRAAADPASRRLAAEACVAAAPASDHRPGPRRGRPLAHPRAGKRARYRAGRRPPGKCVRHRAGRRPRGRRACRHVGRRDPARAGRGRLPRRAARPGGE